MVYINYLGSFTRMIWIWIKLTKFYLEKKQPKLQQTAVKKHTAKPTSPPLPSSRVRIAGTLGPPSRCGGRKSDSTPRVQNWLALYP